MKPKPHRRTSLDAKLSRTFLLARWPEAEGNPVCPACFDGKDVRPLKQGPRSTVLRGDLPRHHCRCCIRNLSPIQDTPLMRSDLPLVYWAFFVMAGLDQNWNKMARDWGVTRATLHRIKKRLGHEHPCMNRWREQLALADITGEQLYARAVKKKDES